LVFRASPPAFCKNIISSKMTLDLILSNYYSMRPAFPWKWGAGVTLPADTGPDPLSEQYFAHVLSSRAVLPDRYSSVDLGMQVNLSYHYIIFYLKGPSGQITVDRPQEWHHWIGLGRTILATLIKNFFIFKEIQKGSCSKSYMTDGLLSSYMVK
jgi:hypothetical protein